MLQKSKVSNLDKATSRLLSLAGGRHCRMLTHVSRNVGLCGLGNEFLLFQIEMANLRGIIRMQTIIVRARLTP